MLTETQEQEVAMKFKLTPKGNVILGWTDKNGNTTFKNHQINNEEVRVWQ